MLASVSRLDTVYPSAQAAIALMKQIGIIPGWDEYWDRYFLYELRDVDGGVTPASDRGGERRCGRSLRSWERGPSAAPGPGC